MTEQVFVRAESSEDKDLGECQIFLSYPQSALARVSPEDLGNSFIYYLIANPVFVKRCRHKALCLSPTDTEFTFYCSLEECEKFAYEAKKDLERFCNLSLKNALDPIKMALEEADMN